MRLRPFGIGSDAAVLVFSLDDAPAPPSRGRARPLLRGRRRAARWWPPRERPALRGGRRPRGLDPVALADRARDALDGASARPARRGAARGAGGRAPAQLPRGPLRARGRGARQRRRAAGRLLPRPRRVPAAPVAPGRRRAAALLRQRARPARGRERRVRRRADPLARGLHRAERPVGARRARALLPPAHASLPDHARRAAHRPRPVERARPDRVLAGAASPGAREP